MKKILLLAAVLSLSACGTLSSDTAHTNATIDAESAKYAETLCAGAGLKLEKIQVIKTQELHRKPTRWIIHAYCEAGITITMDVVKKEKLLNKNDTRKEI